MRSAARLGVEECESNSPGKSRRDRVAACVDLWQRRVEPVVPDLRRASRVDERRIEHELVPDAANIPLDQITDVELATGGPGIDRFALVARRESGGDDPRVPCRAPERGRDVPRK